MTNSKMAFPFCSVYSIYLGIFGVYSIYLTYIPGVLACIFLIYFWKFEHIKCYQMLTNFSKCFCNEYITLLAFCGSGRGLRMLLVPAANLEWLFKSDIMGPRILGLEELQNHRARIQRETLCFWELPSEVPSAQGQINNSNGFWAKTRLENSFSGLAVLRLPQIRAFRYTTKICLKAKYFMLSNTSRI